MGGLLARAAMAAPRVNGNFKGTGKATAERQGQGQVQGQTTSGDAGREVRFDFERLRAYQLAAEFVVWADEQVKRHIRGARIWPTSSIARLLPLP